MTSDDDDGYLTSAVRCGVQGPKGRAKPGLPWTPCRTVLRCHHHHCRRSSFGLAARQVRQRFTESEDLLAIGRTKEARGYQVFLNPDRQKDQNGRFLALANRGCNTPLSASAPPKCNPGRSPGTLPSGAVATETTQAPRREFGVALPGSWPARRAQIRSGHARIPASTQASSLHPAQINVKRGPGRSSGWGLSGLDPVSFLGSPFENLRANREPALPTIKTGWLSSLGVSLN